MGQGTKTIFPQLVAEALGVPFEAVDIAPQDTAFVPDSGPTVASRTAMVVGGLLIQAAGRLRAQVETGDGRPFADDVSRLRPRARRAPHRPAVRALSGRRLRRRRPTAATPTRRSAGRPAWRASRSTSTRARSTSATSSPPTTSAGSSTRSWPRARSRAARSRPSATPRSRRSSCATAATSTTASRRTSSRPRSTRRGSRRSSSRRRSMACRTAPRGSASCRWTSGHRPWSRRSRMRPGSWITRPAGQPGAHPRRAGRRARRPRHCAGRLGAGARPMTTVRFTVNAAPVELEVPGHAPAARRRCARTCA